MHTPKPKRTESNIIKEARALRAKRALQKKTKKEKEGYKYFVYAHELGFGQHHKVYFRNLKSAQSWINKSGTMGTVYDLNEKLVWTNINEPLS
jgi:hypothetical protein